MATVTGFTAPRMLEIENNTVVDGTVDENGHLILTTHGGDNIDAGKVKGDKGESGGPGAEGPAGSPNPEPVAPTSLTVLSNTAFHTPAGQPVSTVVFTWPIPIYDIIGDTPAIDGYELWSRVPAAANSALLTGSEANTVSVTTMAPGVTSLVKVRAHSYQGEWGAFSPEISVTPAVPSENVPKAPGNARVTSNVGTYRADGRAESVLKFMWDAVTTSVDADPVSVQTYEVWFTLNGLASPILATPETAVSLSFPSGTLVTLQVRAMSSFGIWGDLSAPDVVTAAFPVQNNNPASIPTLTTNMGVVYSNWDGKIGANPAGPEFQHLMTETAPVPAGPWTAIGIPAVTAGNTASIPSAPGASVSVRFKWRDKLGRVSSGISPVASITVIGIDQSDFTPDLSDMITDLEKAVISVVTEYAVNSSETVPPATGWSTATPARTPGTFVWMRTTTNYADGSHTTSNPVLVTGNTGSSGGAGTPGVGISGTTVTYQVHTSGTTAPTGTWFATPQATSPGQFLWTRTVTTYTDTTTSTAYSVSAHGATGTNGANGAPGVGVSGTVVTYQVHTSGTVAPTGTWLSSPAATSPGQFLWTRTVTTYTDASTATAYSVSAHGATGATGNTGAAGKGISSTVVEYQVGSSGTTAPTGTWTTTPGATTTGQFLWTRTTITYTDATVVPVYSVSAHGATGSTGLTGNTGAPGAPGTDATTVQVGNDAVAIPTDTSGTTTQTFAITIPFSGWIGNARAAATIVATGLPTGITSGTNTPATTSADGSLILNVASASTLGGTSYGEITLTVTCNSKTFTQKFTWSKAPQGATGSTGGTGGTGAPGTSATAIDVGNEAVTIPTDTAGNTVGASTITVPFTGYVGATRTATTVTVSGLPTGITVQTNTPGTSVAAGSLVLAVASGSALGGTLSGDIVLTVTCNAIVFTQILSWSKAPAGATGSTGSTGSPGAAGVDATNVVIGNDAVAIPTDPTGATTTSYILTIPFSGWIGNARAAATITATGLPTGITLGTNTPATVSADGSLLLNVASGSTLGGTMFGEITLTVTCNAKAFIQKFSWSKAPQGATGSTGSTGGTGSAGAPGAAATSIDVGMSSAVIPTDAAGNTTGTSTITIPFTGFVGATRAAITITPTGLPAGISVGTNTAGTAAAAGSLVLNVASASSLGGTTSGIITLTLVCNGITFTQTFTWSKAPAGATGSTGGTGATGGTGPAGADATYVTLGNDSVSIPTDSTGTTASAFVLTIPFGGYIGNARAAATIAPTGLPTGITAGTNTPATVSADGSLLLNVANGSTLGGTSSGEITLTITCNSKTFVYKFSWAKAPAGATGSTGGTGSAGISATSVDVGNEAIVIPTNSSGYTYGATTFTVPFTGYVGNTRAAITAVVSGLPTGITVQTNIAGTAAAAGSLVFAVAGSSALDGTNLGNITVTLTCNAIVFTQIVSWAKAYSGSSGTPGKGVSSITPYYLQQGTGVAAPAAPTTNPPGGSWVITEPGYLSSTELYRSDLYVFTDATFGYTSVSKVSAYTAATQAMTAANLAQASANGLIKASQTDPGQAIGRIWLVLNATGNVIGIKISNGSTWSSYILMADQILVPSSVGTVQIADGAVNAPKVNAGSIWADDAWLNVLRAGIIEASMVNAAFGKELTLESNVAINTIITTQTSQAIDLNNTKNNLTTTNGQVSNLSTQVGVVDGKAGSAQSAADAAQSAANAAQASIAQTQTWFRVDAQGAHVGQSGSPFQTHIYPDRFAITDNGVETTTWSSGKMSVKIVEATQQILLAKHQIEPYPNPLVSPPTGTIIRST